MVECARVAVRHDVRLREFYERLGVGVVMEGCCGVAAKMLEIVWFMLTRREPYESRDSRLYGDKLNRLGR